MNNVTPYNKDESKKQQVQKMFDSIAAKYDFLNHLLSFGIDHFWRKRLIQVAKKHNHNSILDIATGTADLAIAASKIQPEKIYGIDISEKMLRIGENKINKLKLNNIIKLQKGDAENLPFDNDSFDIVMVAFGIRNFENLDKGLNEINRVLKSKGLFIALEFAKPVSFPVKQIYNFYSKRILPLAGKKISGDKKAYSYLPESVQLFPEGEDLIKIIQLQNFKDTGYKPLSFRIVSLYYGYKM